MQTNLFSVLVCLHFFSICSSVKHVAVFRENHDCLRTLQDDHVDPLIDKDVTKWYGQIYTLDEQCKIALGPESYFGRVGLDCFIASVVFCL